MGLGDTLQTPAIVLLQNSGGQGVLELAFSQFWKGEVHTQSIEQPMPLAGPKERNHTISYFFNKYIGHVLVTFSFLRHNAQHRKLKGGKVHLDTVCGGSFS